MPDADTSLLRATLRNVIAETIAATPELKSADSGGTSGGMEARVARLESDMEHVKKDVAELKTDMKAVRASIHGLELKFAGFDERLRHLPTTAQMWTAAIGIVGALGGIVALIVRFLPAAG